MNTQHISAPQPFLHPRWSAFRTALTTAGMGAVLVALTACGPGADDGSAPAVTQTRADAPSGASVPTATGAATADPSGFMDMDFPSGTVDQQLVDADGNHINISRDTGDGSSTISNSSCDGTSCETQVIVND